MNETDTSYGIGHEIGTGAAARTEEHATEYCACERRRIELANQPTILALRSKIGVLKDTADDIESRIPRATPPGEARSRTRKATLFWSVAALLSIAGFIFAMIAFEPFRMGWKAWLYCVGIAVTTPFLVDQVLDSWPNPNLLRAVRTVACIAAILSGILLAVIRGDLFKQEIAQDNPAVTANSDDPSTLASPNATTPPLTGENFYDSTLGLLRLAMALLAFAMELGAGLAAHEARRWSASGEDSETLRNKLMAVRDEMVSLGHNLWLLENESAIFESSFWRDFYRSLLTKTVTGAMRKLPLFILATVLLVHPHLYAADCFDLVALPDLSQSVAAEDQNQRSEFQQNIEAVAHLLASLPAGSKVAVYGITDNSFAKPYPLLSAQLSSDEGYFKERLSQGRMQLVHLWKQRSRRLEPVFLHTDILGALQLASQHFDRAPSPCHKVLVVLSDMRQSTAILKLEEPRRVDNPQALRTVLSAELTADLHGVDVYALGVDAAQTTVAGWRNLHLFWEAYFQSAGAHLVTYSVTRETPHLEGK